MRCPHCGIDNDKVLDSRLAREGAAIRRRRECVGCGYRFTTYEEIVRDEVVVVKRDNQREEFDRAKLDRAVRRAFGKKRTVPDETVRSIIDRVVMRLDDSEVTSARIAEIVMDELHKVDEVAYIRFASVYRRFTDVAQFLAMITEIVRR